MLLNCNIAIKFISMNFLVYVNKLMCISFVSSKTILKFLFTLINTKPEWVETVDRTQHNLIIVKHIEMSNYSNWINSWQIIKLAMTLLYKLWCCFFFFINFCDVSVESFIILNNTIIRMVSIQNESSAF